MIVVGGRGGADALGALRQRPFDGLDAVGDSDEEGNDDDGEGRKQAVAGLSLSNPDSGISRPRVRQGP